jgi:hypothetical protein
MRLFLLLAQDTQYRLKSHFQIRSNNETHLLNRLHLGFISKQSLLIADLSNPSHRSPDGQQLESDSDRFNTSSL